MSERFSRCLRRQRNQNLNDCNSAEKQRLGVEYHEHENGDETASGPKNVVENDFVHFKVGDFRANPTNENLVVLCSEFLEFL